MPVTLDTIPTPALVIDLAIVRRNLARWAAYARQHNLAIRPHIKTHKSLLMAREQMAAGSSGLTCAKVGEAEVMAQACDDLLIAYPALDPARTARIAQLARQHAVRVAVDSALAIDALADAGRRADATIGVLVDLDIGFHRTGVQTPAQSLALAQRVATTKGVRLDGLFIYPGHIGVPHAQQAQPLATVAALLAQALDLWRQAGLSTAIVSSGSTPTGLMSHLTPGITEIRPGTYIYMDRNCLAGQWCAIDDCAARIVCTVVSDAVPGKCVLDAGSKAFTSDRLIVSPDTSGHGLIVEYPQARIVKCTEEHGEVDLSLCDRRPKLGERVHVIPNHICPCVNLQDIAWLKHEDGALEPMPIDARGRLS